MPLCVQVQHLVAVGHCSVMPIGREILSMRSLTTDYTALLVFISRRVFHTCPHSSLFPLLSSFHRNFHIIEVAGRRSIYVRATHGALRLMHVAERGEVVLNHKLNKTRKMFSVYSSWVQGQAKIQWWEEGIPAILLFTIGLNKWVIYPQKLLQRYRSASLILNKFWEVIYIASVPWYT